MAKSFLRLLGLALALFIHSALADDLQDIRARGVLRHLGIPYANFVTGSGDGLDVEIVQRFARHLGVRYEFVESTWPTVLGDLTGKEYSFKPSIRETGSRPVRGDIVATGLTILPARKQIIDYSDPTFPSAVWLLARADSGITPITPSGNLERDIKATKAVMKRGATFVADNSCLDPTLYGLEGKGLKLKRFVLGRTVINDIVPAMLKRESDMTLLDVPDVLLALELHRSRWLGQLFGRARRQAREQAAAMLEQVGLSDCLQRYPAELSGGMQQRLAIAQSLVRAPQVLLLDEPFGALDPGIRADMQLLIQRIWRETGVTVFMITHDLSEGFKLGTRLLVFDRPRHDPQAPQAFGATITYDIPLRNRRAGDLPPDLAERIAAREPTREESTP